MEPGSTQQCMVWEHESYQAYIETRKFQTGYKEKIFIMRTVKQCNRLPRKAVEFPFLKILKPQLDTVLRNLL